jgi:Fe-S-cluster-containing hydrogenase component 2
VKGCHGGALQLINGKAKIINEMFCDGLGACIGECPVGALSLEEREVTPYKEKPCCGVVPSKRQFPIQLRLVSPGATFLQNQDLVLAADCTAFVCKDFHDSFIKNNSLVIACPKLDSDKELYVEKLKTMIDHSAIKSLTVIMMEVPCCSGLWNIAQQAQEKSMRKIPIKEVIIEIK